MNNDLEQKNIIISSVEALTWGLKVTDEKGLKYNVPKFKKDTEIKTVAYATLEAYPNNGLNLNKCFKFVTIPNKKGGQSRYVRVITEPVQDGQPTTYASPQMQQSKPVTIEKETTDWDKISWGKCKHAYLVELFKEKISDPSNYDYNQNQAEREAEEWADMSMRRLKDTQTAQDIADMVGGKVVDDEINLDEVPF